MLQLYSLNSNGTVLFHPDVMNIVPEFSVLSNEDKLFLVLAYDYNGPFNQFPQNDAITKAAQRAYGSYENKVIQRTIMKNAIEMYNSLQYNPKRETIKVYRAKLRMLDNEISGDVSSLELKKLLESQKLLRIALKEMEEEAQNEIEIKNTIKGGGSLSFLEEIMKNKAEYDRIKTKQLKK